LIPELGEAAGSADVVIDRHHNARLPTARGGIAAPVSRACCWPADHPPPPRLRSRSSVQMHAFIVLTPATSTAFTFRVRWSGRGCSALEGAQEAAGLAASSLVSYSLVAIGVTPFARRSEMYQLATPLPLPKYSASWCRRQPPPPQGAPLVLSFNLREKNAARCRPRWCHAKVCSVDGQVPGASTPVRLANLCRTVRGCSPVVRERATPAIFDRTVDCDWRAGGHCSRTEGPHPPSVDRVPFRLRLLCRGLRRRVHLVVKVSIPPRTSYWCWPACHRRPVEKAPLMIVLPV